LLHTNPAYTSSVYSLGRFAGRCNLGRDIRLGHLATRGLKRRSLPKANDQARRGAIRLKIVASTGAKAYVNRAWSDPPCSLFTKCARPAGRIRTQRLYAETSSSAVRLTRLSRVPRAHSTGGAPRQHRLPPALEHRSPCNNQNNLRGK